MNLLLVFKIKRLKDIQYSTQINYQFVCVLFLFKYFVLLSRFPRGQLQPVVFSLSCSHRSLAKILFNKICIYNEIL
ncbi:hypothetical protein BUZ15_09870 [Staphylococcus gallinarum]|nr:hypothetical protein BUZ15_09870 [Staphylococcus gallinarum]